MQIEPLVDHLDLVPTIAAWHWQEWGPTAMEGDATRRAEKLRIRLHRDRVPVMYVALDTNDGRVPLGTSALVESDMDTHLELSPWLANVYVTPPARGRGIARALVQHAMNQAAALRLSRLYLYTHTARGLYEKLGWYVIGEEPYEGHHVTIMGYDVPHA